MSNAKGSDKSNKISSTPNKVTATSRSEAKSASSQNLRQTVQKAVAMPAAAVRAAMASARTGAAAARVAYDVLSRLLTLVESGVVIDAKTLQLTKSAIDTVGITDDVSIVNLGKFHAQIVTLNDVLTRIVSYYRTYNDTAVSQDQPAKTISKAPFADTANYSDSRVFTIGKNFSEVLQTADNFGKVVSYVRNYQDIVQTADVKSFVVNKPKSDVISLADTFPKLISKPRADTFGLSDSDVLTFGKNVTEILQSNDTNTLLFTKRISDFLLVADQFLGESGVLVVSDSEVDLSAISDSLSRVVAFVRFFQDTARSTDTLSRVTQKPRQDTLTVNQQLTRVVSFNRAFNDTDTAVDVLTRVVNFRRTFAEPITSPDATAKSITKAPFVDNVSYGDSNSLQYGKPKANLIAAADSFNRLVSFSRSFNSGANTVDTADIIATVKQFNRAFSEVPNIVENFSKVVTYIRQATPETQVATDNFTKLVSFVRTRSEIQQAADNFVKVVSFIRSFTETTTASETFSLTMLFARSFSETSRATDQITARVFSKVLSDVIRVSESLYFSAIIEPSAFPPADTQSISDSIRKIVSFVRNYADTAKAQDTDVITYNKVAGANVFNVWSDFNELQGTYELCQYYPDYRVEYLKLNETFAKNYSKRIGPFTYYTDATWTDFNELSLGADIDQEVAQEFWRQAYSLDHDLVTFTETFRKTVSYVRTYNDTVGSADTTGRFFSRTVGDVRSRVFDDFAELFYTGETYANIRGYGATISVSQSAGVYSAIVVNGGFGFTAGHSFRVQLDSARSCTFTVATVNGSGTILTISGLSVSTTPVRSSVLSDFLDFVYPILDDSESTNNYTISFTDTGTIVASVGPESLSRHSVLGQELLFTLRDRADGDKVSYTDTAARTFNKVAVDPYPQGFWNDYNELSFGGPSYLDQTLVQSFVKFKPTSVTILDVASLATLGFTKTNSETVNLLEVKTITLRKSAVDTVGAGNETLVKNISKTAGDFQVNTWTDLQEFIFSGLMGIDYGTRYDIVRVPDAIAKTYSKPYIYSNRYVWRDFNDLTFATTDDQDQLFDWGVTDYSDITRTMDDARRTIQPNKSEQINLLEGIGKEVSINGGDGRLASSFRDFLGINPIGEHSPTGEPIMDEELTLTFVPGRKTDFVRSTDSAPKTFTKYPVIRVAPYWSDFAELTLGTTYDQELLQYQPTTRPETIKTADLFAKIWSASRTFNDTVTVTDSMLLSKNGGPLFTLLYGTNDISRASESLARFVGLSAGNVSSYYSTWQDYPELEVSLELAQYYYRGTDSTVDIGKITDQKTNLFTKQGGRTQSIMDYFFNEEIFYDRDLRLQFAQDYVTEIIRTIDTPLFAYGKNSVEFVRLTETMPRVITKPYVGDTIVPVDRNIWNPLYIQNVSNYEEDIRFGNYPDTKVDSITLPENQINYATKDLGFGPVNTWNDYLETARSVYDLTLLTYGFYGVSNNTFAQTIFNRYLDEIVDEEHYELIRSPYRTEIIAATDAFTRTISYNRNYAENLNAVSQPSLQYSTTKVETVGVAFNSNRQFGKTAGQNVWQVWDDYVELHPFNELAQNYPDYRVEYLRSVDVSTRQFTKAPADIARPTDSIAFVKGKNPSDLPRATDLPQKGYSKILGDQSDFAWVDSNEILSFDPRLLTFGAYTEFKRDKVRTLDSDTVQYNKTAGSYRAHVWDDFMEVERFTELTQYWPDYVTELILPSEQVSFNLTKRISDTFEANSSGVARLYPPNGYATNTPIVYFADDYEDSIVSSTF